ncbi:MAG: condensation domain-containing protein [Blastocatellia bacterium]|nr:condensation domain-containing protein [Blastocatellia bacterium]
MANLVQLNPVKSHPRGNGSGGKILLVKPPYFTPWTPPLGIAIIKSYLAESGYGAKCFDFNIDPELWGMHHKYFAQLQELEDVSINDGYSKLWWILNSHLLAYVNGADAETCAEVLRSVIPVYQIRCTNRTIERLVLLVEGFFRRLEEITGQIDLSEYSAVGTSTYTTSLSASLFILRLIKQTKPSIKTIMGGGVFADDLALGSENLDVLINEYPFVDHIVLGEGELLLSEIISGRLEDSRVVSIASINGKTLDMREVPKPDFSDLDGSLYHHLSIEGARSCPFQCSFCSETIQWGDYRKKPVDQFANQVIELARHYNKNTFFMGDSLMNPYINSFASELIDRKADILYDGYLRADKPVSNRRFVRMWADSGLFRVRLGIESASAKVLDSMDKMTTPDVISEALKTLASEGIRTTTYWIVGFPGESEEEFQESCHFIRNHYRYIYELEAHPYYYYPYGQVGSRLHECYSLYPNEVTDIIKFKVWEIVDANPMREERYDRLRRISKLAADLGLPNIYTMAQRYEAEDRWARLHPLAVEIYGRSRIHREAARLPKHPVRVFAQELLPERSESSSPSELIECYQASVKKSLDEKILTDAMLRLIQHNEMLLMGLENEKYFLPADGDHWQSSQLLFVHEMGADSGAEPSKQLMIENLAAGMRPEPGKSVKALLFKGESQTCELLLLAHRAVADRKSVILLFEDLFRIYEQLYNHREISLAPVEAGYSDFILKATKSDDYKIECENLTINLRDTRVPRPEHQSEIESETSDSRILPLDAGVSESLLSLLPSEYDLDPGQVVASALVRALAGEIEAGSLSVDVTQNLRQRHPELWGTVGALTLTRRLPESLLNTLRSEARFSEVVIALKEYSSNWQVDEAEGQTTTNRLLLDLECLKDDPWLGGDQWVPRGFVVTRNAPRRHYDLEVLPVCCGRQVNIHLIYRVSEFSNKVLDQLCATLPAKIEASLSHCENYKAAKQYWLKEFSSEAMESSGAMPVDRPATSVFERMSRPCSIERSTLERAALKCQTSIQNLFLCAFSVLLSRLTGQETLTLVMCLVDDAGAHAVPLRLQPSWDASLSAFAREVAEKVTLSQRHGAAAFDILFDQVASRRALPSFDTAFIADESSRYQVSDLWSILKGDQRPAAGEIALALKVSTVNQKPGAELVYIAERFELQMIERMELYLQNILEQAAKESNVRIGDIAFDSREKSSDVSQLLAMEKFQF